MLIVIILNTLVFGTIAGIVISAAVSPKARAFWRSIWALAIYTWRESMRKKTLIGFLILSILVIFGSNFMTAFLTDTSIGEVETDVDVKLIKDICVTAISIFGVLIAIFVSASAVPTEVENKVIYTVLSKPVRRFQYLLGKFVGIQLTIILNLVLMGSLFFVALWAKQHILPTLLLWSILFTYFEFLVVSAFTFAVSCTATSAVLPTIAGLFIYVTGHMVEYLKDVSARATQYDTKYSEIVGKLANALHSILPNLKTFSLKTHILNLQPNDPPVDVQIPNVILYGLLYAISGYILAYWIFRRKEM